MTSPISRTRGFLFADLRGYSAYTERHGDRAAAALIHRYRELVRKQIATFDGAEVRTEGDSFYVVFDSVGHAVRAALAIGDAARATRDDGGPIAVGIGVHAGEVEDGEDGIVSSAVNLAARVCSVAPAGQVLVTDTVRSLVRTALPVHFTPVGRRRLKGIAEPVALYRVVREATATPTRRSPVPFVVGGAALVVVLAVAVVAGRDPQSLPSQTAATSAPAASAAPSPAQTRDLSRFSDPGEFPNDAEQVLLGRLPAALADSCERADLDDRPAFHLPPGPDPEFPLPIRAGVSCLKDGVRVHYWQHSPSGDQTSPGRASVTDLLFTTVSRLSLTEGSCQTESRVYQAWEAGVHSGYVVCYVGADGDATMQWTFDGPGIYAVASRRGAETRELYAWWAETGRRLGR